MDLADSATQPTTLRSALYQLGTLVLLFLTHPFGVLTYLVFGLVMALFHFRDRTMFRKTVIPLVLVTLAFVVWFVISSTQANTPKYDWEIQWLSAQEVTTFYVSMFTGMRWFNGVNFYAVALWASAFGLLVYFAAGEWKHLRVSTPLAALLTLTLLGYATLPYWIGYYAFFNLRLAPITYVLLAWIFTGVRMPHAVGQICATLAAGLVAISINLHATISAETEQLLPILAKMEKNSAVLPILLDSHTTALDSEIFPELHANDHYYYHVLVGGGVNPLPFPNPMLPVHLRHERGWPTPKALEQFLPQLWQELISKYRYLLIRSNPAQPIQQLLQFATLVERSGPWTLLETRNRIDTPIKGSP